MNLLDLCFEREQQERKERTMNRTRREAIDDLIEQLENIQQQIETLKDEEQTAYDNMPEGLQCSERGETITEAIDNLESAESSVEETIGYLTSAKGE